MGDTVDSALSEVLLELGLNKDEVDITIIEKPRKGVLGIGRGKAKIEVIEKKKTEMRAVWKNAAG